MQLRVISGGYTNSLAVMLSVAASYNSKAQYSAGKAIHLWGNRWTFSYREPGNPDVVIDYKRTNAVHNSECLAAEAMANFVWGMNNLINKGA